MSSNELELTTAWDEPDNRDYLFEDLTEFAASNGEEIHKRPIDEVTVFNQGNNPSCTVHAGTHIVNWMNIIEDRKYWACRQQIDPLSLWQLFCAERWYSDRWSSIQTVAGWLKKRWLIAGYVSITNSDPLEDVQRKVDTALDMWMFIYTGSAFWDRAKIKKTGIYCEREPKVFVWHAWDIVIKEKAWDYYKCLNSYGDKRWPHNWYFLLHKDDLKKIYSKIIFIDKDDKDLFKHFEETQKIKQAILLLRQVYYTTDNRKLQMFLESVQMGKNFSEILWVEI